MKQHFLIVDTETTVQDKVYDFAAILVTRKGEILKECAVIVRDFAEQKLFHNIASSDLWSLANLTRRHEAYNTMLQNGSRMLASVAAINRWLERVRGEYKPELTAYNLAFDSEKCRNSGIDTAIFDRQFCLWHLAVGHFANSKKFRNFILQNHLFNSPTKFGNMTFKTNAEVMASFLNGEMLPPEPHTALEDAKLYELPILLAIVKRKKWRERILPYNWKAWQVKNHFCAR